MGDDENRWETLWGCITLVAYPLLILKGLALLATYLSFSFHIDILMWIFAGLMFIYLMTGDFPSDKGEWTFMGIFSVFLWLIMNFLSWLIPI